MTMTEQHKTADQQPVNKAEVPSKPKAKRVPRWVALASLVVGVAAGGGLTGELVHKHDVNTENNLKAKADLAIRLGNMGITGVVSDSAGTNGNLVEITTDPGIKNAPEFDFRVL